MKNFKNENIIYITLIIVLLFMMLSDIPLCDSITAIFSILLFIFFIILTYKLIAFWNKHKEFRKNIIAFFSTVLIVVIFAVICIGLLGLGAVLQKQIDPPTLEYGASVIGNILTVSITMLTVVMTLKSGERQRKKDKELELKPILKASRLSERTYGSIDKRTEYNVGKVKSSYQEVYISSQSSTEYILGYRFEISNIGRGEGINLVLKSIVFKSDEISEKIPFPIEKSNIVPTIPVNQSVDYMFDLIISESIFNWIKGNEHGDSFNITFTFECCNIFQTPLTFEFTFYTTCCKPLPNENKTINPYHLIIFNKISTKIIDTSYE